MKCLSEDGLSLTKLIMLSSDGPNVKKSLKIKLNDEVKQLGGQALVDIGSCTLHIAHNSFRSGIAAVGSLEIDEFLMDVFYRFKNFPARKEDYVSLNEALTNNEISSTFLRFVSNRWLSMGPVIVRIIEQ